MPTSDKRQEDWLVDTSVAVPLLVVDHEHHGSVAAALHGRRLGLAGHAAFETFSVLTRLPPPARRTAQAVSRLLAAEFPMTRFLGPATAEEVLGRLGPLGLSGGSVYDALVAAAAAEHGLTLITRDRRALPTYRTLDVEVELLP